MKQINKANSIMSVDSSGLPKFLDLYTTLSVCQTLEFLPHVIRKIHPHPHIFFPVFFPVSFTPPSLRNSYKLKFSGKRVKQNIKNVAAATRTKFKH